MIKKLLSDETGVVFPSEMVLILAVLACVSSIAWAVGRGPSDLQDSPKVATNRIPQAEISIISDRVGGVKKKPQFTRSVTSSPAADTVEQTDQAIFNLTICGKEDRGFTYYDD